MISRQVFIAACVGVVFFLLVGVTGLFRPEKIKPYALKRSGGPLQKLNPFVPWMKTRQYIWSLRLTGLISMAAAALLIWILIQTIRLGRLGPP
jgi:hypothetical protein